MNTQFKRILTLMSIFLIIFSSVPTKVDAHVAYFLQVLIDEGQLQYASNVVENSELLEGNKTEAKHWDYSGGVITGAEDAYKALEGESKSDALWFTFPSKAIKNVGLFAKNNATSKDEARAYEIADTLIPNINELLILMNGGKPFKNTDDLISMAEELARNSESGSTINKNGTTITFGGNYANVQIGNMTNSYLVKMKKGYKSQYLEQTMKSDGSLGEAKESRIYNSDFASEYGEDAEFITIGNMITQANYTYLVKGHSAMDSAEYANPGTLEIKLMELMSSFTASLKSLLSLRDINALVFNDGIIGTTMYYNGLMPTSWFQKSMAFHMIFQAMTWIALGVAIIKLALQRNLATISASSRISLMDGIKDLIVAGFLLMGIFIAINLMGGLNKAIVNIFANTSPNYGETLNKGLEMGTIGGDMLQLYYFLITLYLNVIYVARAISLAVLIAIGPIFVGSIAFQTKNKELFETWGRMLFADIFVQSFHAFVLSFFLSIQMSTTRGIELAVVSFALIPATKMFKEIITKNSGGLMNVAGNGLAMAGSAAAAGFGMARGKSDYKGSMDENGFNSAMNKEGISRRTPDKSTTKDALNNMKVNPSGEMGVTNPTSKFDKIREVASSQAVQNTARTAGSVAKDVMVGGAKVTAGVAAGLAFGSVDGGRMGGSIVRSGVGDLKSGVGTAASVAATGVGQGFNTIKGKMLNDSFSGAETLPNGNIAIHRDKGVLNGMGLEDATMNDKDNLQLTYDTSKLNSSDKGNIATIRDKYMQGDVKYLESRGVSSVHDTQDGKVAVEYNDYGKEQLGYNKAYTTKNRIVETKRAGQPVESSLTYDVNKVNSGTSKNSSNSYKSNESTGSSRTIYDGPSNGGESLERGQSLNMSLDDQMGF